MLTRLLIILLAAGSFAQAAHAGGDELPDMQADRSLVSMKASRTEARSGRERDASGKAGVIEIWRDRVFATLGASLVPPAQDGTLIAGRAPEGPADQERMVARAAVKETVKLALERMPEVDRIVKALRFEVSTEQFRDDRSAQPAAEETRPAQAAASRRTAPQERFFLKTGLRIPIDNARPGVLSETSAVYGKFSSFFKLRLDGRSDARLGMRYDLSPAVHLQLERQVAHDGPTSQMIQLVCAF